MYLFVDENPNSLGEERVFAASGDKRGVLAVQVNTPDKSVAWCDVTGVEEGGLFTEAFAQRVEDSSDGTAWLIFGGGWGLRLRLEKSNSQWSFEDKTQWGLPFLVLDSSASSIRFK